VLLDVFRMAGTDLYDAILEDVAGVHRRIPRERMRYALEFRTSPRRTAARDPCPQRPGHAQPNDRV